MWLTYQLSHGDTATVLHAQGEIDAFTSERLGEGLRTALGDAGKQVVLDLRGVTFIDGSGLRLLDTWGHDCRERHLSFGLAGPAPHIRRLLHLVDLDTVLPVLGASADDADDAVEAGGGAAAGDVRRLSRGWNGLAGASGTGRKLAIELTLDRATIRLVRKLVAAAAQIEGASDLDAHLIEVAAGEVLARRCPPDPGEPASALVSVELRGDRFTLALAAGRGAPAALEASSDSERAAARWGFYVIARLMDEVEIRPPRTRGQAPELRLVKRIGSSEQGARRGRIA